MFDRNLRGLRRHERSLLCLLLLGTGFPLLCWVSLHLLEEHLLTCLFQCRDNLFDDTVVDLPFLGFLALLDPLQGAAFSKGFIAKLYTGAVT